MADKKNDKSRQFQNMGLAATAGTLLVSSILIGYFLGTWLDDKLRSAPVCMAIGVLLGMVAGFVELIRMIQRISGGPPDRGSK